MDNEAKVFLSNVPRSQTSINNNLYDLLPRNPIKPIQNSKVYEEPPTIELKTEKSFNTKRNIKIKVKTVKHIRKELEEYVNTYLSKDLDTQRKYLLKKIRHATLQDSSTISLAKNIYQSDEPVSKTVWQMLANINPLHYKYKSQFVRWNKQNIRINGSIGGDKMFLTCYDVCYKKSHVDMNKIPITNSGIKRRSLLHDSLQIQFKPGPLSKKRKLDESCQKNKNQIEVVNLPEVSLEIFPSYGMTLNPVYGYFQDAVTVDGIITYVGADFATSVLGKLRDKTLIQSDKNVSLVLRLKYENDQNRILMRKNVEYSENSTHPVELCSKRMDDYSIHKEVALVLENIVRTVDISVMQDNMFCEPENTSNNIKTIMHDGASKCKNKRKWGELRKLNVSVTKLSESDVECEKSYCSMGCICSSLECNNNDKSHCKRLECMFQCTCEYSRNESIFICNNKIQAEILNKKSKILTRLAKEKEHTLKNVPDFGDISCNSTESSFSSGLNGILKPFKNIDKLTREIKVSVQKINCENIQPWCMVHHLYKCFCKGRFTESLSINYSNCNLSIVNKNTFNDVLPLNETYLKTVEDAPEQKEDNITQFALEFPADLKKKQYQPEAISRSLSVEHLQSSCARLKQYFRRFDENYYLKKNQTILRIERYDKGLQRKLAAIITKMSNPDITTTQLKTCNQDIIDKLIHHETNAAQDINSKSYPVPQIQINYPNAINVKKSKLLLANCVEKIYKKYLEKLESGKSILAMEPPRSGQFELYPWEVILNRYREKKNYFLVTHSHPSRIFIAVNQNNSFFSDCINIDDISVIDLHKYPVIVKNLLTNTNEAENTFCILRGLTLSWELIGSVTKIKDKNDQFRSNSEIDTFSEPEESMNLLKNNFNNEKLVDNSDDIINKPLDKNINKSLDETINKSLVEDTNKSLDETINKSLDENINKSLDDYINKSLHENINKSSDENMDYSWWFLALIADDCSEFQFSNKGFFVKFETILKAIKVARMSQKTVRLSAQSCNQDGRSPQFGIYATPSDDIFRVFIGPYEKGEKLGLEIIKAGDSNTKTRGAWITMNKHDNKKILENAISLLKQIDNAKLSYMLLENILFESQQNAINISSCPDESNSDNQSAGEGGIMENELLRSPTQLNQTKVKSPKIIKIHKSNKFYKIAPVHYLKSNSLLKTFCKNVEAEQSIKSHLKSVPEPILDTNVLQIKSKHTLFTNTPVLSDKDSVKNVKKPGDCGMFILKPEEINRKLLQNKLSSNTFMSVYKENDNINNLENKLNNKEDIPETKNPNELLTQFVFSNSSSSSLESSPSKVNSEVYTNVWIECTNVKNFGCIRGRLNIDNKLAFQFPGFKFSEYYTENEAFEIINQALARKVFVPQSLQLKWRVVNQEIYMLKTDDLKPEFALTRKGLQHREQFEGHYDSIKSALLELQYVVEPGCNKVFHDPMDIVTEAKKIVEELLRQNNKLENDKNMMELDISLNVSKIMNLSINLPDTVFNNVQDNLKYIMKSKFDLLNIHRSDGSEMKADQTKEKL